MVCGGVQTPLEATLMGRGEDALGWPDGLTVPTVHRAEKQPAHLPIVPYPQTSQTEKTRPKFSSNWSHSGQVSFAPMGVCGVELKQFFVVRNFSGFS